MEALCAQVGEGGEAATSLRWLAGGNEAPHRDLADYLLDQAEGDFDEYVAEEEDPDEEGGEVVFDPNNLMHVALRKQGLM